MQSLALPAPASHALANAALKYRFGEDHQPVTVLQLLTPRRREDYNDDLWTVYQRVQENLIKGGLSGRTVAISKPETTNYCQHFRSSIPSLKNILQLKIVSE